MQMVKIQIPERSDRAKSLVEMARRGRVVCLPDNVFGSCGESGGGTGFQPVSVPDFTGKMPVPRAGTTDFPT
jgi:hypothetical protein